MEIVTLGRREALREAVIPLSENDVLSLSERLGESDGLRERRLAAWQLAEAMPMPTTSDEPWRRTDIRMLHWEEAMRITGEPRAALADVPSELYAPLIGEQQGGLMVFHNGRLVHREVSPALEQTGVIFTDLAAASNQYADILHKWFMSQAVTGEEDKIAALSGALWTHGILVYVPRNVRVDLPLHSVEYVSSLETTGTHILVVLEEGASVTYLHESASPTLEGQLLHLGTTELLVGRNADLRYVALQNWGENVFNFGHQRGRVAQDGRLDWVVGEMGTRLSKLFQTLDLDGNGSWGRMSGLYFAHQRQHLDLDTQQNHHAIGTTSDLLFKALRDRAGRSGRA
jgi:Fe-S cluster assembly protein SufD